jgi:fucose permease
MNDGVPLPPTPRRPLVSILLAYALFVWVGVGAGVSGVLLLAQLRDYDVDQATIGLTFFTGSAGFVLAGASAGALVHRWGTRIALLIGGGVYVLAGASIATRPAFVAFVLLQVLTGYGVGVLESLLNTYLAALPEPTTLLNRLHAFFGVGALLGPLLATWMLRFTTWPMVALVVTALCVPLLAGVLVAYPHRAGDPVATSASADPATSPEGARRGSLAIALRHPGVLLGATLLSVYVGLELGMGNWGFSYLVNAREVPDLVAGYTVSGYWLGLTLGRFLISPVTVRIGMSAAGLMYLCMAGVIAATALTWLVPAAGVTSLGFILMGFFLGPIFPTTMAVVPQVTTPQLAPTAIGVMNAGSVIGGSALPWLAGAAAQGLGAWTLLPYTLLLAALQLVVWWRMVGRMAVPAGVPITPVVP